MATNKHAIIRYQILDKCFRNTGKKYSITDLLNECNKALVEFSGQESGIQKRQLYEDIKFMESEQGWSITLIKERDGRKVYYRYEDQHFSINSQPLNETEEHQLKEALLILSRFKGMPQFQWVDEISARLESGLGLQNSDRQIIEFEHNEYLKGLEHITPIFNAIQYGKVLEIKYQDFKSSKQRIFYIHPYYLKQYNNRWFLLGQNDGFENITNIALDRIVEIKDSSKIFIKNTLIDFSEYFEDVIGVTVKNDIPLLKIEIWIEKSLYPYIKTKPMHGSQKVIDENKHGVILLLQIVPNYEFESLILSFGNRIEVLKPASIRNLFKNRIKSLFNRYE